ncbi:MAG: response regulator [Pirellulaceae bacterium]
MDRVLVAEDSFALSNLLSFVLTNAGFQVTQQHTGTGAMECAVSEEFDAILLDQQMPGMLGTEVLAALRSSGPNKRTPVILCTAKTHELDLEQICEEMNVTDVFHKPFSPKDLVSRLKEELHPTECA